MAESESSVRAIGGKENEFMKRRIKYEDAPHDVEKSLKTNIRVLDFLPSPNQLVEKVRKEKITISLNKRSIDFFKKAADREGVGYQTMINNLLDAYVQRHV
jgi:predicted DNA binding CopG/RHH family protein